MKLGVGGGVLSAIIHCNKFYLPLSKMDSLANSPGSSVEVRQVKNPPSQAPSEPMASESSDDEFWPLSGKPYFHVILSKSHLKLPYHLPVPVKLSAVLPSRVVPAFITYRGKKWRMVFHGEYKCKRMHSGWGKFVIDNKLKVGDACVFELLECSSQKITFRAQILRGDIPPEFSHWMTGSHHLQWHACYHRGGKSDYSGELERVKGCASSLRCIFIQGSGWKYSCRK